MPVELLEYQLLLPAFALVLARVAGLVLAVPMLASSQIPPIVKAWLAVTLALMTFPAVFDTLPTSLTLGQAAAGMAGEFIFGEILGLGAGIAFFAAQVAGKIVSHQSGMALGVVFNPLFDDESTALDQVWFFGTLMIFLALRGHLAVAQVLLDSFRHVPPLYVVLDGDLADFFIGALRGVFDMAVRLSGPAVLALLLTSLIMGFLTKTMPQLNILSVGFAVKIATALFFAGLTLAYSDEMVGDAIFDWLGELGFVIESMSRRVTYAG